ncbi:hypothetical protein CCP3SC15_150038 [Gammaproteobacteria bacterium]
MPILGTGNWLKAETVNTGETLVFENGGEWVESKYKCAALKQDGTPNPMAGQPKHDLVFKVRVGGVQYDFRCNVTNRNILQEKFGRNTDLWKGVICKIDICKVSVGGKIQDSIILTPIGKEKDVEPDEAAGPEEIAWEN